VTRLLHESTDAIFPTLPPAEQREPVDAGARNTTDTGSPTDEHRAVGSARDDAGSVPNDVSARLAGEEHAKDVFSFRRAGARRFWSTVAITVLLAGAIQTGLAGLPAPQMLALFMGAVAGNWALVWVATHPRLYRRWMRYCFAAFDSALISVVVLAFGAPVLAISYLLAIVPYSFDRGRALGYTSAVTAVVGFLAACWGHGAFGFGEPVPMVDALLAAALILLVALQVIPLGSRLVRRVRTTRHRMELVERGELAVRADARHDDELGFLERAYNRMLDRLGALVESQQREASEVAAVAAQLTQAAHELHARSRAASTAARQLSVRLGDQQRVGQEAGGATRGARDDAHHAAQQAQALAAQSTAMDEAAHASDEAVSEATTTLTRIADGVRRTAQRVEALDPASVRVHDAVVTISRLARRTNLLALNAGIEAARANEHGVGFAVVAEEIRTLAQESATAATSIAETVARVRAEIDAAVQDMRSTARLVEDTEHVAREATAALSSVRGTGALVRGSAGTLAELASAQARAMTALTAAIEEVDALAEEAAVHARAAADAADAQAAASAQVSGGATQLAAAAARLRGEGGR
jgi:methyl-accepting chemotaxis protein